MKKYVVFIFSILIWNGAIAQSQINLGKSRATKVAASITNINSNKFRIEINIPAISYEKKVFSAGEFVEITVNDLSKSNDIGKPEIPIYSKLIEVPIDATVKMNVLSYDEELISLSDWGVSSLIKPAQPSERKDSDKSAAFQYDRQTYTKKGYVNEEIARFEDEGIMRSCRIGQIIVAPIQYSPIGNKLRVLNNILVEVEFVGADEDKTMNLKRMYADPIFTRTMSNSGIGIAPSVYDDTKRRTYVIVSNIMFQNALQPFINHKKLQGYNVIVSYTNNSNVGNTTTSIKNYLKGLYESPAQGMAPPLYVLLVGDTEYIPAFNAGEHVTDLYYFDYTGDYLPEVMYGRFSASTVEQLQNIIEKTITYDRKDAPVPAYMKQSVLIAGNDATHELTYGNGMVNYGMTYYFNSNNGITLYPYLQDEPAGANYSQSIIQKVNSGIGFINYSGHGSPDGWVDPQFNKTNIYNLSNNGKYGLWIGNCCYSNKFNVAECFGEAVLRAKSKGGVGYIGATDKTYWEPDYYWSIGYRSSITANPTYNNNDLGAYDRLFHTHGESSDGWAITQGQILLAGNLAVQSSQSNRKKYYWEIYHLMGDPSLRIIVNDASCTTTTLTGNITQNRIVYDCRINVGNAKISNNASVELNAEKDVIINTNFEVELGATLNIK